MKPDPNVSHCVPTFLRRYDMVTIIEVINLCLQLDQVVSVQLHDEEGHSKHHLKVNPLGPDWMTIVCTSVPVFTRMGTDTISYWSHICHELPGVIMGVLLGLTDQDWTTLTTHMNRLLSGDIDSFVITDPDTEKKYRLTSELKTDTKLQYSGSPSIYFYQTSYRERLAPGFFVPLNPGIHFLGSAYQQSISSKGQSKEDKDTKDTLLTLCAPSLSELVTGICRIGGQEGSSIWLCHNRVGQIIGSVVHYGGQLYLLKSNVVHSPDFFQSSPILIKVDDMNQLIQVITTLNQLFRGETSGILVHSEHEPDGILKFMISRQNPYYDMVTSRWKPLRSRKWTCQTKSKKKTHTPSAVDNLSSTDLIPPIPVISSVSETTDASSMLQKRTLPEPEEGLPECKRKKISKTPPSNFSSTDER